MASITLVILFTIDRTTVIVSPNACQNFRSPVTLIFLENNFHSKFIMLMIST